jgi:hypothetical protein
MGSTLRRRLQRLGGKRRDIPHCIGKGQEVIRAGLLGC